MSFARFLRYSTTIGIGGYSAYVLQQNNWDARNIGIVRFGRAAWIVGQVSVDYKFSVSELTDDSEETCEKWSQCHLRSAQRLLKLCSQNGGVFIKVGQHIAALDYLVPKEYVDTLKVLHSRGPRTDLIDIEKVIKEETGKEVNQLFDNFDPEPLGAASLAQVHKATLKTTGETVAVKVQHPNVLRHSVVDMATMEFLFTVVSKIFPSFNFLWLAAETRRNLPFELDFYNEGKNSETMAGILAKFPWLKVPKIYWNLTSKRTLVMEYAEGNFVSDREYFIKAKIDTAELCNRIEQMYSEMIFLSGTVHCDPHPGNILVKKNGRDFNIVLLDHGLLTRLTDEFRETYCCMWMAVLNGNEPEIIRCAKKMGIDLGKEHYAQLLSCMITAKPWSAVKRGLANVPDEKTRNAEKDELRKNASRYFGDISKILATVDRQLLLLMKTNDLIRSIAFTLGNDERRSFLTMTKACYSMLQQKKARESGNSLVKLALQMQSQWFFFKIWVYSLYLWLTWTGPSRKMVA